MNEADREDRPSQKALIHNIQAAVIVHDADTQIIDCNSKAEELSGLTKDQLMGRDAIDGRWRFLDGDGESMPVEDYPVNRVVATGKPLHGMTACIVRPEKLNPVWVLVDAVPSTDDEGNILQVVVTFMDITKLKQTEEEREKLIVELQAAVEEIKTLRGIFPICSSCKKIRDDRGYWNRIEEYVRDHTEADFSHGLCPECMTKLYPEFQGETEG